MALAIGSATIRSAQKHDSLTWIESSSMNSTSLFRIEPSDKDPSTSCRQRMNGAKSRANNSASKCSRSAAHEDTHCLTAMIACHRGLADSFAILIVCRLVSRRRESRITCAATARLSSLTSVRPSVDCKIILFNVE